MPLVEDALKTGLEAAAAIGMAGGSQADCMAAMAKAITDHIKTATVTTATVVTCSTGPTSGTGTGGLS